MSIFISVWLLCGVIGVGIAARKGLQEGRNVIVEDVVVGFIVASFGPITLLYVLSKIGALKTVIWRVKK